MVVPRRPEARVPHASISAELEKSVCACVVEGGERFQQLERRRGERVCASVWLTDRVRMCEKKTMCHCVCVCYALSESEKVRVCV